MPILTKPGSFTKGTPAALTLNKSLLAAVTSVAGNAYFSDSANWKFVNMFYKSSTGNQRFSAKFDCSEGTPASSFITSSRARDIFQIQRIVIVDFDGGQFLVNRSELTPSEFDLDYTPAPTGLIWDTLFTPGAMTLGANGAITPTAGATWGVAAASSAFINDNVDFTLTYSINGNSAGIEIMYGFEGALPTDGLVDYGFYLRGGSANIRVAGITAFTVAVPDVSTLVITRSGSNLDFKVNGTTAYSITYTGKMYPNVGFGSNHSILLSTYLV